MTDYLCRTINELEKYLEDNCFSFDQLSIGKHCAAEGIIVEELHSKYIFAHSERGNKRILKSFDKECNLVQYSLKELQNDKWSNANLVAATFDKSEISDAEYYLHRKRIKFKRNDVPNYKSGFTAYRIFAFGTDIKLLDDFKKKYLHY